MNTKTTPATATTVTPGRRGVLVARSAIVATTVTIAAIGPGLGLAQALMGRNHNEVLATSRR
ncbi:hypothetical protein [Rhodococcus daqingensis]|uniref:Uncharacterized protein n=1 Tax=Rhodococcus daqingensis TaxID=2479363 RepID=A0ABW2S611_9NOCA